MKNPKAASLLLLTLLLFFGAHSRAQDLKSLLDQATRPTMEQVFSITSKSETKSEDLKDTEAELLSRLADGGPTLLAEMEAAFPGATWAFLGRDGENVADLVEAFYLSQGERGRVVRIGASGNTFAGASDSEIVEYLETRGLNLKAIKDQRPFIFVDVIATGGRQPRQILSSVYRVYAEQGGAPADLITKVNLFGLDSRGKDYPAISPLEAQSELPKIAEEYRREGRTGFPNGLPIVRRTNDATKINVAGYGDFGVKAWHATFGALYRKDLKSPPSTEPGSPSPSYTRWAILQLQTEVKHLVHQPEFLSRVQAEAKRLGVRSLLKK